MTQTPSYSDTSLLLLHLVSGFRLHSAQTITLRSQNFHQRTFAMRLSSALGARFLELTRGAMFLTSSSTGLPGGLQGLRLYVAALCCSSCCRHLSGLASRFMRAWTRRTRTMDSKPMCWSFTGRRTGCWECQSFIDESSFSRKEILRITK